MMETTDMRRPMNALLLVLAALALTACRNNNGRPAEPRDPGAGAPAAKTPAAAPTEFTGTLRGGAVAIGGETTGWRLEGDGETGGLDVDVSKVRDRAKQLDGKRVTITGRTTRRNYVERGGTPVILAETIQPAPQPKK
jgi:hypothetical protein